MFTQDTRSPIERNSPLLCMTSNHGDKFLPTPVGPENPERLAK